MDRTAHIFAELHILEPTTQGLTASQRVAAIFIDLKPELDKEEAIQAAYEAEQNAIELAEIGYPMPRKRVVVRYYGHRAKELDGTDHGENTCFATVHKQFDGHKMWATLFGACRPRCFYDDQIIRNGSRT